MDILSTEKRSEVMSRIRGQDTKPEMMVRRLVHRLGYRYRLHGKHLPGKPDLVFPGRKKVIFVHGCFWHQHSGCKAATMPKTRADFWRNKLERNVERDEQQKAELANGGWEVLTIWECQLQQNDLVERIQSFLDETGSSPDLEHDKDTTGKS